MERMGQVVAGAQPGGGRGTRQYQTSDQSAQGKRKWSGRGQGAAGAQDGGGGGTRLCKTSDQSAQGKRTWRGWGR
jgi:hypothetical protein